MPPNWLSGSIYLNEGAEVISEGSNSLINLPIQKIDVIERPFGGDRVAERYPRISRTNNIYPMIYNGAFYISLLGPRNFDERGYEKNSGKIFVVRKFSAENKILDVCYFFNLFNT